MPKVTKKKDSKRYLVRHLWYLSDAQNVVRQLQAVIWPLGWHVVLGGGVLNHGYSNDDLDLYLLPIYRPELVHDEDDLESAIGELMDVLDRDYSENAPSLEGQLPSKTCFQLARRYVYGPEAKPVDVFVVRP